LELRYARAVTRQEAEERAERLQAEYPERHFVARESREGGWEVAGVALPKELRRTPLTPTIDASPRPSPADDPRTGHERRVPGTSGGL
jgi:hypothetical protein